MWIAMATFFLGHLATQIEVSSVQKMMTSKHNNCFELPLLWNFPLFLFHSLTVFQICNSGQGNSRLKSNLVLVATNPQEYETMNTEPASSPSSGSSANGDDFLVLPSPTLMALSYMKDTSYDETARSNKVHNDKAANNQRDSTDTNQDVNSQTETDHKSGRYEYMEITRSKSSDEFDLKLDASQMLDVKTEETNQAVEVLTNQHKEEEETVKIHDTNHQSTLPEDLSCVVTHVPDVLVGGGGKVEEYEEMVFGVVPDGWRHTEYQNLPVKGRAVPEEKGGGRCAGTRDYIKVCSGLGDAGNNTSFDNPDYWHSRLFLKPDAVRT